MNVPDDKTTAECFHSITEDVAADCLYNILHEFRIVGFYAYPFLCRAHAFIGDGFSAELIGTDPRLHICKSVS